MTTGDTPPASPALGAWTYRVAALPGGRWHTLSFVGNEYPDGTSVDPDALTVELPLDRLVGTADLDEQHRTRVILPRTLLPDAPDMWFVEIPGDELDRRSQTLVAFATPHLPDGTVIGNAAFFSMPIKSSEQAGAIKWWTDDGLIEQLFVAPDFRGGAAVARKLGYTASGFHRHHGWPGMIRVGGRRTDMGERAIKYAHPTRIAPRTETSILIDPLTGEPRT